MDVWTSRQPAMLRGTLRLPTQFASRLIPTVYVRPSHSMASPHQLDREAMSSLQLSKIMTRMTFDRTPQHFFLQSTTSITLIPRLW